MGAGWIWNTLADSASSHHIPSLAPAVALPAPRHDRRRTGAAGSPPGGFPFVEFRCADVKCAAALGEPRSVSVFIGGASRFSPPFVPAKAGTQRRPGFPLEFTLAQAGAGMNGALCATEQIEARTRAPSLDSGNSLCYRTQPLRGPPAAGVSGA
jgi:hypothetical protein